MHYLYSILKGMGSILFSLALLGVGGACSSIQTKPQLKERLVELGCKQDQGFMILYAEGNYLFPAQMPPGCRCFIQIDGIEYVTTVGGPSSKCKDSKK